MEWSNNINRLVKYKIMISLFKPKVSVKTHIGYFQHTNDPKLEKDGNNKQPYLFITVRNNTKKDVIIHQIVQETKQHYRNIGIKQRPLPYVLSPGKSWETWTIANSFPLTKKYNPFNTILAFISTNGKIKEYRSKFDKHCPDWGPVPDGSY